MNRQVANQTIAYSYLNADRNILTLDGIPVLTKYPRLQFELPPEGDTTSWCYKEFVRALDRGEAFLLDSSAYASFVNGMIDDNDTIVFRAMEDATVDGEQGWKFLQGVTPEERRHPDHRHSHEQKPGTVVRSSEQTQFIRHNLPRQRVNSQYHDLEPVWNQTTSVAEDPEEKLFLQDDPEFDTLRTRIVDSWSKVIAGAYVSADLPRPPEEIRRVIHEIADRRWYTRDYFTVLDNGPTAVSRDFWERTLRQGEEMRAKYGEANLVPYSDFEWGLLNGKLQALWWALGNPWNDPNGE